MFFFDFLENNDFLFIFVGSGRDSFLYIVFLEGTLIVKFFYFFLLVYSVIFFEKKYFRVKLFFFKGSVI